MSLLICEPAGPTEPPCLFFEVAPLSCLFFEVAPLSCPPNGSLPILRSGAGVLSPGFLGLELVCVMGQRYLLQRRCWTSDSALEKMVGSMGVAAVLCQREWFPRCFSQGVCLGTSSPEFRCAVPKVRAELRRHQSQAADPPDSPPSPLDS